MQQVVKTHVKYCFPEKLIRDLKPRVWGGGGADDRHNLLGITKIETQNEEFGIYCKQLRH